MKRLILLAFFILLLLPVCADAHSGYYDFFDFENYVGNDTTLWTVPQSGTYGSWAINNRAGEDGNDGVTSVKTDKGTSLCLIRKYATYPGVNYGFISPHDDVSETLHTSFSVMISGDIPGGYGVFRYRKSGDTTPYNIIVFRDNGEIEICGEKLKTNGALVHYEKDKWYDVRVTYDVPTSYYEILIKDDSEFFVEHSGCSGYEKQLTSINLIMFEMIGEYNPQHVEARVYLDDWQVNTVSRIYVSNKTEDFSDFAFSSDGTKVSKGWILTDFIGKTDESAEYAGVFEETVSQNDKALAICKNNGIPLTLWGKFKNKTVGASIFQTDLTLYNLSCDVLVSLGDSTVYKDALLIESGSGRLYVFGKYSGQNLVVGKKYNLSVAFDNKTSCGYVITDDGKRIRKSAFDFLPFDTHISSYKISLKGTPYPSASIMKAVFDNISLLGCKNIYNSYSSGSNFDILSCNQISDNSYTLVMNNPIDTNIMPLIKFNNEIVNYEFSDNNSIKVFWSGDNGNVNVVVSGISDIYGNTIKTSYEFVKSNINNRFVISKPVFFSKKSDMYSIATELLPGNIYTSFHIKKFK